MRTLHFVIKVGFRRRECRICAASKSSLLEFAVLVPTATATPALVKVFHLSRTVLQSWDVGEVVVMVAATMPCRGSYNLYVSLLFMGSPIIITSYTDQITTFSTREALEWLFQIKEIRRPTKIWTGMACHFQLIVGVVMRGFDANAIDIGGWKRSCATANAELSVGELLIVQIWYRTGVLDRPSGKFRLLRSRWWR